MKKILLLQTGGTIAMDINPEGKPELDEQSWNRLIDRKIPELNDIADIDIASPFFKDSADAGIAQWQQLIKTIAEQYDQYDGFVILYGTDTMAYTASALSFGLQNLGKPVILTGSQVPMANIRSDARRNLVNAIEMATLKLSEVAICFNDYVYRGNRTTKISINDFDAFASPNYPPLAKIGLNINVKESDHPPSQKLKPISEFSDQVFLLKIYPNLNPEFLDQIHFEQTRAIVVEAFGSGNFPVHGTQSLLPFLKKIKALDIPLIITSQAAYDSVDLSNYESGRKAAEVGAISAGDMTTEATLTKIIHLLGNGYDDEELKKKIQQNLTGELTEE